MRQKLGQHFLTNHSVLTKIAAALDIDHNDTVIEIGPGHGELTAEIVKYGPKQLILLERDPELAAAARENFKGKVEVVEGDALKTLPQTVEGLKGYKLAGNIPYYLTGFLFRTIAELSKKPSLAVFTIQKEVAERMTEEPPRMNKLAAAVQFWAEVQIVGHISRRDFSPPPEVDSSTVLLKTRPTTEADAKIYYPLLAALFKQPRKTISNNLLEGGWDREEISARLSALGLDPQMRPQDLSVENILALGRK